MTGKFRQDFQKTYIMINPNERFVIIEKINNNELCSECVTGRTQKWWQSKHNPDSEIPTNIYLLGDGDIKTIFEKYVVEYGKIEWSEFINYTRELIKQGIMT